ncbi:tudor and KH domain-containing protein homolog [Halyomorpha halys]|uniref:tudor and KH domain-containing protein homolog n=1 Tax=Halyomorpha halys TaxID=286706 RepID=UPI0006D4FCA9
MVLMSKPMILFVALPILSIFATTTYFYFCGKKNMENTNDDGRKEVNVKIPLHSVSFIIERGGTYLKDLQEKSQTKITLRYEEGEYNSMICRIVGKNENVDEVMNMIENIIKEGKKKKKELVYLSQIKSHCLRIKNQEHNGAQSHMSDFHYEKLMGVTSGCLISVNVTFVDSPSHFWIQLVTRRIIVLQHLINDMTEYYNNEENRIRHKLSLVQPGRIVACMFRDYKWYRAEVLSVDVMETNESKVKVLYVDYGNTEYYDLKQIFGLKLDFLSLKFQAIEVSMAGIESNNGGDNWDSTSIEAFGDMVCLSEWLEPRLAEVISHKETRGTYSVLNPCIKLYYPDEPLGIDIGKELVEEGFALEVETEEQ